MGIHSRIEEKQREIREYENDIAELENAYDFISLKYNMLENDIYEPDKSYDMTNSNEWRGKLENDSENFLNENCSLIGVILSNTSKHLSNIQRAIVQIRELIRMCEDEIAALEEELRARENEKY